ARSSGRRWWPPRSPPTRRAGRPWAPRSRSPRGTRSRRSRPGTCCAAPASARRSSACATWSRSRRSPGSPRPRSRRRTASPPSGSPYGSAWALWWLGDATGVLLVAPVLLVWAGAGLRLPSRRRCLEAAVLGSALAGVSAAVFLAGLWRYPYPIFPLLVLGALRFRQRGAAAGSFVVAATAVAG